MRRDLYHADCLDVLPLLPADSIDAVVTDPPYNLTNRVPDVLRCRQCQRVLGGRDGEPDACPRCGGALYRQRSGGGGFMGKAWDASGVAFDPETWRQVYRVLKPGGHLLAFGGSRTYHRIAVAIEDAGFEIRDSLMWLYATGFPKSLSVSKAIDRMAGAEREVVGTSPHAANRAADMGYHGGSEHEGIRTITAPATAEAEQWQGWGTALKPAYEPIILARKPLSEKSVAANVLRWGTGAINVDACRIRYKSESDKQSATFRTSAPQGGDLWQGKDTSVRFDGPPKPVNPQGRFPANIVLSHSLWCVPTGTRRVKGGGNKASGSINGPTTAAHTAGGWGHSTPSDVTGYADADGMEEVVAWDCHESCPVALLDAQSGYSKSISAPRNGNNIRGVTGMMAPRADDRVRGHNDTGGASRFFQTFPPEEPERFRYVAKASRRERNAGLEGWPERLPSNAVDRASQRAGEEGAPGRGSLTKPMANTHPTVKPVGILRYLARLITPPGGTVLDPFAGSGSTGIACELEGFGYVLIEQDAEGEGYVQIAGARIKHARIHGERWLDAGVGDRSAPARAVPDARGGTGQLSLFPGGDGGGGHTAPDADQ